MEKSKVLSFIEKYNLSGKNEHVILSIKDGKLSTQFISDDKKVFGYIKYKTGDFSNIENSELGIYETNKLIKFLNTLDNNIVINSVIRNEKIVQLNLKNQDNDKININFALSSTDVIPKVPQLKTEPVYEMIIDVDAEFSNNFIKLKDAFGNEVDLFTVTPIDDSVEISFGQTNNNTNVAKFLANASESVQKGTITFVCDYLKSILTINKNMKSSLKIVYPNASSKYGLAFIEFSDDDFDAKYYLLSVNVEG